jgi:hypothetical protein
MTQQVSMTSQAEEQNVQGCRHYWVIQPATGPVSQGVCQHCGESREFKNYVEASTWGDDKSSNRAGSSAGAYVAQSVADQQEGDSEE